LRMPSIGKVLAAGRLSLVISSDSEADSESVR
jgi:hypothetical protein